MLLACEAPLAWMEEVGEHTDFDYALAHLILSNEPYLQYFRRQLLAGRKIILDNSAFELLAPLSTSEILKARAFILEGTDRGGQIRVVAPDSLGNKRVTQFYVSNFMRESKLSTSEVLVVLQGSDVEDRFQCYRDYRWDGFDQIAIPVGWKKDENGIPHPNKDETERLQLLEKMKDDKSFPYLHLLGCTQFNETLKQYNKYPRVRSIDTSFPVLAAWEGRRLMKDPRKAQVKMNDLFLDSGKDYNRHLIRSNILEFKEMIG